MGTREQNLLGSPLCKQLISLIVLSFLYGLFCSSPPASLSVLVFVFLIVNSK